VRTFDAAALKVRMVGGRGISGERRVGGRLGVGCGVGLGPWYLVRTWDLAAGAGVTGGSGLSVVWHFWCLRGNWAVEQSSGGRGRPPSSWPGFGSRVLDGFGVDTTSCAFSRCGVLGN